MSASILSSLSISAAARGAGEGDVRMPSASTDVDLDRRLHGHLGDRRDPLVGRRARADRRRRRVLRAPRPRPRQCGRTDRHGRGRHGDAAEPVPRHVPARHSTSHARARDRVCGDRYRRGGRRYRRARPSDHAAHHHRVAADPCCSRASSTFSPASRFSNGFKSFLKYPALLVLVPAFLEDSGSLGAILSARVSTKLHLGTLGEEGRSSWRRRH